MADGWELRGVRSVGRDGGKEPPGLRWRVLVVEDDPSTRAMLVEALNDEPDLAAESEDDGAAALEHLAADATVDLVLCDLVMPDVDGFELAARLKEDTATAALPAVAMTALDPAAVATEAHAAGYAAVVAKPFDLAELVAVLRRVLGTRLAARYGRS